MESTLNTRVPHFRFDAVSNVVSGATTVTDPLEKKSTDWTLGVNVGGSMILLVSHGLVMVTVIAKVAVKVIELDAKVAIGDTVYVFDAIVKSDVSILN